MECPLEEYLINPEEVKERLFEERGNDYIGDATEEQALEAANNWFGENIEIRRCEELSIDTPCGFYY